MTIFDFLRKWPKNRIPKLKQIEIKANLSGKNCIECGKPIEGEPDKSLGFNICDNCFTKKTLK